MEAGATGYLVKQTAATDLLKAIREEASRRTYRPVFDAARIEFGSLGDAAGVVGSAGILFDARADAGP